MGNVCINMPENNSISSACLPAGTIGFTRFNTPVIKTNAGCLVNLLNGKVLTTDQQVNATDELILQTSKESN